MCKTVEGVCPWALNTKLLAALEEAETFIWAYSQPGTVGMDMAKRIHDAIAEATGRDVALAYDPKDMHIIAAADELLAALIAARPHIGVGYSAMQRYEITQQVDAAIAKARGE